MAGLRLRRSSLPAASIARFQGGLAHFSQPISSSSPLPLRTLPISSYSSSFDGRIQSPRILSFFSRSARVFTSVRRVSDLRGPIRMTSKVGQAVSGFGSSASATKPEDVVQFWFRDIDPSNNVFISKSWFRGGAEFDKECEEKFGDCLKLASTGALNGWMETVQGRLALVLVLDQMSRNVYRDTPSAFSQDEMAIKITLETIEQGLDKQLEPLERWFLYLPLMHSENIGNHDIAERVYQELAGEFTENEILHERLMSVVQFEREHRAVIEKFGRYPGRNQVLGRPSTKEEEEFLSTAEEW